MRLLPKILLTPLIAGLVVSPVYAELSAMQWVQKMSDAMRNLNYRGNFVYMHQNQLESMQVTHYRDAQGEKERLLSLNGEAREVLRDGQNLTCIWPSSRKVVVDLSRQNSFSPIFIPEDIERLEKYYEMKLAGRDRIADKETQVVHIDPRDRYRYGLKFWIDRNHGLMMKSSLMDEQGREIEQVMFTSLEIFADGDEPAIDTIPEIGENYARVQYHRGKPATTVANGMRWQLTEVPGGFWRESALDRKLEGSDQVVHQLVYTDGLASLSVFIERRTDDTPTGSMSMGAVNAFVRVLNDHSVTAIGEVPAITVRKIAEAVSDQAR